MRTFRLLFWMLLPGCVTGCGLETYLAKVKKQKSRLSHFEQEQKYLGDPLELTQQTDRKASRVDRLYFRPPKGISQNPEEKLTKDVLSWFTSGDKSNKDRVDNLYVAVAVGGEKFTILKDDKPVELTGEDAFEKRVLDALGRTNKEALERRTFQTTPRPGDPAQEMELIIFNKEFREGISRFFVYFAEKKKVAIVFDVVGDAESTKAARELSLATLRIDQEAWERQRGE